MGKFSLSLEEIEKQISLVDGSKTQAALDNRKNNPQLTALKPVQNSTNIKAELPALNKVQPSAPLAQPTTKEDKIDKWLNPSYKMSKEEKKEAKELTDAFMSEVHNRKFDGSDEEYKRMTDLYNKSHTGAAVMSGFIDALPFYKYAMDGAAKLAGTDESFSDFMDRTTQNAQAQNKGAYWAGNIGTNLGEYAVGTKLLEGLGLLGEGGKITQGVSKVIKNQKLANGAANVLGDMTLDVALDTVPTTIDNARSGMDAGEVAKEAGKNIGVNLAFNVGGETVAKPLINKIFGGKTVKNTKLPKLGDDVVEEVETIAKQSDKLPEQVAKQADDLTNAPQNIENTVVAKDIPKPVNTPSNLSKQIQDSYNGLKVNDAVAADVDSKLKELYSYVDRVNNTQSKQELLELMDAFNNKTVEIDELLKGNASHSSMEDNGSKQLFDEFYNALKGKKINISDANMADANYKTIKAINDSIYSGIGSGKFAKNSGTPLDEIFGEIDNDMGGKLSAFMRNSGMNPDNPADQYKGLVEYAQSVKHKDAMTNVETPYDSNMLFGDDVYDAFMKSANEQYNKLNTPSKTIAENVGITPTAESIEIPVDSNYKVSKTRSNTLKKSGVNSKKELASEYLDESKFVYKEITEKESMQGAINRIATDSQWWYDELMKADDFTGTDVDTMMIMYRKLVNEARATDSSDLWEQASAVFKKIQETGTKNGQAIQAFAKWSRNTPEGVVADTFKNIKQKIAKQLGDKQAVKIMDELTTELQKEIYELADTAFREGIDSRAGKEAFAQIGKIVNKNTPKSLKGIVKSYLMDSMLLNFRTLITRNAGGNLGYNAMEFIRQPITAGVDTAVSKLTGQRTRTGWKTDKIASAFSGLAKGIADEARDIQKGIHTLKSGQNTISDAIYSNSNPFKGNNVITKALNKIDDLTKHGLSVGDRPFYEAAYKQRLSELNDLRARGLLGEEVMKLSDDDFNVMAEMAAKLDGLTATYQDDAAMAKALEGLKSAVGKFSEGFAGTDVLSQFVMPFTRTPGNIITRSLEYSPYGLVKNTVNTVGELRKGNFNQQRFVDEAGRNILGTGLFAGGIAAYDNGLITGGYSDDKDMANAQKQAGMQEYALRTNIGGKEGNFDISWLPVLGNDLVAAAAFKEAYDADTESPLNAGVKGALTGANTLLNTSTLQGMNRMFGGNTSYSSEQNLLANAKDALTSGFGQAIPSLMRQAVQSADPLQRNVSNGDREYWQNNLMASLPVLREELQPKIDNEGNVMLNNQGRDLGSRIVENMVIPGKYTELQDSVVNDEAMRLFESTGSNVAFLPTPNREDLTSKNGYEATDERFYKYQVELGRKNAETARAVIESEFYRGLSDEQKTEVLSDVYSAMKAVVKEKMVVGYSSDNKLASVYKSDGVRGVVNYLSGKQLANSYGIDSNYDSSLEFIDTYGADAYKEAGDAISSLGLKQSKANRELYVSGGLQALEIASYADTDGNGEITKDAELIPYLKMQNWTAEEKNRVVEQFGFSTKNLKW